LIWSSSSSSSVQSCVVIDALAEELEPKPKPCFLGGLFIGLLLGAVHPRPKDYALAGLALCTSMTIRLVSE